MVPRLNGRCVSQPTDVDAGAAAATLAAALRARHPEAGRAYWALRTWALLVWQPTYASVLAVELASGVLPLDGLRWQVDTDDADVIGFASPASGLMAADARERRPLAARELQALTTTLLPAVQSCLPLHPKAARLMQADCVLAALLRAQRAAKLTDDGVRRAGEDWLAQLGAPRDSGYLAFATTSGASRLALDRGICCLDDHRAGGELCNTCPRLPRAERLRRLSAQDLRTSA